MEVVESKSEWVEYFFFNLRLLIILCVLVEWSVNKFNELVSDLCAAYITWKDFPHTHQKYIHSFTRQDRPLLLMGREKTVEKFCRLFFSKILDFCHKTKDCKFLTLFSKTLRNVSYQLKVKHLRENLWKTIKTDILSDSSIIWFFSLWFTSYLDLNKQCLSHSLLFIRARLSEMQITASFLIYSLLCLGTCYQK